LPQLAAFGEQHLQVLKTITEGRTITQVIPLEKDARINELAMMMGTISEGTRRSARELLQSAAQLTGRQQA
jgi:DNA repair protein RecN (Recombination protein N)